LNEFSFFGNPNYFFTQVEWKTHTQKFPFLVNHIFSFKLNECGLLHASNKAHLLPLPNPHHTKKWKKTGTTSHAVLQRWSVPGAKRCGIPLNRGSKCVARASLWLTAQNPVK